MSCSCRVDFMAVACSLTRSCRLILLGGSERICTHVHCMLVLCPVPPGCTLLASSVHVHSVHPLFIACSPHVQRTCILCPLRNSAFNECSLQVHFPYMCNICVGRMFHHMFSVIAEGPCHGFCQATDLKNIFTSRVCISCLLSSYHEGAMCIACSNHGH